MNATKVTASSPQVSIKADDDGYLVRIRPRAGSAVYVVCEPLIQDGPATALKFDQTGPAPVRVCAVKEFSR